MQLRLKTYITAGVLLCFISLALFGFAGMLSATGMEVSNACLASLAQNGACPPGNAFGLALFHADAFKVFSTTLPSTPFIPALFAFFILLSLAGAGLAGTLLSQSLVCVRTLAYRVGTVMLGYFAHRTLRLALIRFEHSPTS